MIRGMRSRFAMAVKCLELGTKCQAMILTYRALGYSEDEALERWRADLALCSRQAANTRLTPNEGVGRGVQARTAV